MGTTVEINGVRYSIRKLPEGDISVRHANGQYNPLHGPGSEGVHAFLVHPCQRHQYEFWNAHLPPEERDRDGEGREGPQPSWSLRKARTDTSIESTASMLSKQRRRK